MVAMLAEEARTDGPNIIRIDSDQARITCMRCHAALLEAVYWRGTRTGWRLLKICAYCRYNVAQAQMRREEEAALVQIYDLASDPVRGRRGYVEDGQLRCSACRSTVYREMSLIWTANAPSMYVVEVLCWMAGHVLQVRWYRGSPIKKRFPTSDTAPTLTESFRTKKVVIQAEAPKTLASKMPATLPPAPKRTFQRGALPLSMRRVIQDFESEIDGCDQRCVTFRYIDPDDIDGPIHVMMRHSPLAHNLFGDGTESSERQEYEWPGLRVDFGTMTLYVDGEPSVLAPTVKEWRLLRVLAQNNGTVVHQDRLLATVWGPEYVEQNGYHLLRVNVARLRPKLDRRSAQNPDRFIVTKSGIGYMMRKALVSAATAAI
jgi:DNA-binding winged helix-turn-helix (wHTH) protein